MFVRLVAKCPTNQWMASNEPFIPNLRKYLLAVRLQQNNFYKVNMIHDGRRS